MSQDSSRDIQVEKRLLGALCAEPNRLLDIDQSLITRDDFFHNIAKCTYAALKSVAEHDKSLGRSQAVDAVVLEEKVAELFPKFYEQSRTQINTAITELCAMPALNDRDLRSAAGAVLKNSVRRRSKKVLEKVGREIDTCKGPAEILSHLENEVFQFTVNAQNSSDIVVLGDDYATFLSDREKEAQNGNIHVGIETPFPEYNRSIGGGYRPGTINVVGARSKMGKSWFGLKIADHVARMGTPVLYLDTELEDNYQTDRRCAQCTGIPIHQLETMQFKSRPDWVDKVKNFVGERQQFPVYYVDIKGWPIERQISVIRRFFAKYVGRKPNGKFKEALVILDYLKLMTANDKGSDKEWEALGYRMTLLHDLMGEYNNPMLALVQLNRDGLEKENEATVSGSDRIIWLSDNFSIIAPLDDAAMASANDDTTNPTPGGPPPRVPNTKLKVVVCRHGPGTPRSSYISMYWDIRDPRLGHDEVCGYIEEGPRRRS